jgi:hypothetical protein
MTTTASLSEEIAPPMADVDEGSNSVEKPQRRFPYRMWHLLALPVRLVVLLLWLDRQSLLPTTPWSSQRLMTIDFEIRGGDHQRPLRNVRIELYTPKSVSKAIVHTAEDGRASLSVELDVSGEANMFGRAGDVSVEPLWLSISAEGYQDVLLLFRYAFYHRSNTHPRLRYLLTPLPHTR